MSTLDDHANSASSRTIPEPISAARAGISKVVRRRALIDPGNERLWFATSLVACSLVAVTTAWLFARATGQLKLTVPMPQAPGGSVTIVKHSVVMMIGGMSAFAMFMAPLPSAPRARLGAMSKTPPMLIIGTGLGALVGTHRLVGMVLLCMLATGLVLLQRLPRLLPLAFPAFFGLFLAIFIKLTKEQIPWVAATVVLASITSIACNMLLFRPSPERSLARIRRAFDLAADHAIDACIQLLRAQAPGEISSALSRATAAAIGLDEVALTVDVKLADAASELGQGVIDRSHHDVFDREASIHAVIRAAIAAVRSDVPISDRLLMADVLTEYHSGSIEVARELANRRAIESHRRLLSASDETREPARTDYHAAVALLEIVGPAATPATQAVVAPTFRPSVVAMGGVLAGSGPAAARAQTPATMSRGARIMPPVITARAVRILIAVSAATAIGDFVSPIRWYWAFFTAFAVMSVANTAAEHIRSSIERAIGTALGVAGGIAVSHLLADSLPVSFVLIFVAMGVAFYFQRPSSLLNTLAMTLMLSQLYLQLGSYSDRVLLTRMSETAIGAGVAIMVSLTVFRVRTSTVALHAIALHLAALDRVIDNSIEHVAGSRPSTELRSDVRALQDAHQQLRKTIVPSTVLFRRYTHGTTHAQLMLLGALTHDAANVARRATTADPFADVFRDDLRRVGAELRRGIRVIAEAFDDGVAGDEAFVLSHPLDDIDLALRHHTPSSPAPQLAIIHEIGVLEEHLIELAHTAGVPVEVRSSAASPRIRYIPLGAS